MQKCRQDSFCEEIVVCVFSIGSQLPTAGLAITKIPKASVWYTKP